MEAILDKTAGFDGARANAQANAIIQGISHLPGWGEKNFQVSQTAKLAACQVKPFCTLD